MPAIQYDAIYSVNGPGLDEVRAPSRAGTYVIPESFTLVSVVSLPSKKWAVHLAIRRPGPSRLRILPHCQAAIGLGYEDEWGNP